MNKEYYIKNRIAILKHVNARCYKARELINKAKFVPCADCNIQYNPWVIQFDHRYNKLFNIATMRSYSVQKIKAEIEKCDIVCTNCHAERTHKRLIHNQQPNTI